MKRIISILLTVTIIASLCTFNVFAEDTGAFKSVTIPGIIEGENYDKGSTGSYSSDGRNNGGMYRPDDPIDVMPTNCEYQIVLLDGDWVKYTFNVPSDGAYLIRLDGTGKGEMRIDDVTNYIDFETDDADKADVVSVWFTQGKHNIKIRSTQLLLVNYIQFYVTSREYKTIDELKTYVKPEDELDKKIYKVLECEDNGAYIDYQGKNVAPNKTETSTYASGGKYINSEFQHITWNFTPDKTGYYEFELVASIEGDTGNSTFSVGDESEFVNRKLNTPGSLSLQDKAKTNLGKYYLSKDTQYTLKMQLGWDGVVVRYDCFNVYYEEAPYVLDNNVYMNIYVSPTGNDSNDGKTQSTAFLTLERAKQEVEGNNENMTGHIVVNVMPGYYHIDETLVFDEKSSGKNGYDVIYKGTSTTQDTIISGGTQITGWADNDKDGIWTTSANVEDTRTLYINGYPAQRAKSKYLYNILENYSDGVQDSTVRSYHGQSDGFKVSAENFFYNFSQPEALEAVWQLSWTHQRTPVKNVFIDPTDNSKVVFEMDQPAWNIARTKALGDTNPMYFDWAGGVVVDTNKQFYLENAIELLDEPGEFYFDKINKQIHYYPYAQEDLSTAETYVGTTDLMIEVKGNSSTDKVHNIIFDNIDFLYGSWNAASIDGVIGTQADHLANKIEAAVENGGYSLPAQFTVEFANNIKILNCKFASLGSSAIKMENGVSDSLIQGNVIKDVSGTGIMIDSYEHKAVLPEGRERCDNIQVLNNVINRAATEFRGMTGISMFMPSNTTISHNYIKNVPYSGMSLGWGWGGYDCLSAANNAISHNYIEDVMKNCVDGAHIYTLDTMHNGSISDNYLVGAGDWRGGIYLDSGSEGITIERNVVKDSVQWLFARGGVSLKDIIANDNYYDERCCGVEITSAVTQSNNNPVKRNSDGSITWPEAAQKIVNNAGLEDAYSDLKDGTDLPLWRTDVLDMQPKFGYGDHDQFWISATDYTATDIGDIYKRLSPNSARENKYVPISVTNQFLEYTVNVEKQMTYTLQMNVATARNSATASVYVDGGWWPSIRNAKLGPTDTNTDPELPVDWSIYKTCDLGKLTLSPGNHTLKIQVSGALAFVKLRLYNASYFSNESYDEGYMTAQASTFSDIRGHWAEEEITLLSNEGVINGVSEDEYAPEDPLTLYQAVWLVSRCIGLDYTDDSCWKTIAEEYGLMESTREDEIITREEFAHIVMQGYKISKEDTQISAELTFPDSDMISEEFKTSVAEAAKLGFVQGDENGYFNPLNNLTRAEAATIIARLQAAL